MTATVADNALLLGVLAWAKEFGESRLWAGIHFRSDLDSGWEIGRRVGEAVVERAKRDGA